MECNKQAAWVSHFLVCSQSWLRTLKKFGILNCKEFSHLGFFVAVGKPANSFIKNGNLCVFQSNVHFSAILKQDLSVCLPAVGDYIFISHDVHNSNEWTDSTILCCFCIWQQVIGYIWSTFIISFPTRKRRPMALSWWVELLFPPRNEICLWVEFIRAPTLLLELAVFLIHEEISSTSFWDSSTRW